MTDRVRRTSLGLLTFVLISCSAGTTSTSTSEPAMETSTTAPTTTRIETTSTTTTSTTTTTTTPPTTTLPDLSEASIDGSWTAFISYPGNEAEIPDHQRTYVFSSDCTADPCTIAGEIEIASIGRTDVEFRDTPVEQNGSIFTWTFVDEDTAEEGGVTLCKWTVTRTSELRVEEAEMIDGVWMARAMTGDFKEESEVAEQAEGVNCETHTLLGEITLQPVAG